ncbi:MAG: hypothetical protein ACRDH6_08580 [Actinomycetota bacterium]
MIRIAAVGDLHAGEDSSGKIASQFESVGERADALLLAGDLTRHELRGEAEVLVKELAAVSRR